MTENTSFVPLFLGLILTATGVYASCPIELSPPSVVVKYGHSVSVNCSTSEVLFDGIGWEVPQGGTGVEKVNHLTWTVESLTDWDISPHCFLNPPPNGTFQQCSRTAKVVLYTFPEKISISSNSDSTVMIEKEEYNFTCHIHHVAPVQNLTVRWYKGDTLIHTETFGNSNKHPVDQLSVYSFTPTRKDNGVTFRCEAHMDLGPEGPHHSVSSGEFYIIVSFGPDIQCSVIDLSEGQTLDGHCPAEGNPIPQLTWKKDGQQVDPRIPLSRGNAGSYTIVAEGNSLAVKEITVRVSYKPELWCPSSYTALEYAPHNLTCTFDGFPQPQIVWYKDGEEVELPENFTRSDSGQYLITASNRLSSTNLTVEIIVHSPPSQIVELEDTEAEVGSDVSLKCSSSGNPRPEYNWTYYQADNVVEAYEDGVTRLLIHNATAYNIGSYTCHAFNHRGNVSKTARVTVKNATQKCPIEITPDRMVVHYQGPSQTATCNPKHSGNEIDIRWLVQQGIGSNSTTWRVDTHNDWDPRPVCIATFKGIGTCNKSLSFTLYKPPDAVFLRPFTDLSSVVEGEEVQLQCDIINVAPAWNVTVQWYQGNGTLEPFTRGSVRVTGCLSENGTGCDISQIKSPVNVSSTISITVNRTHSGAEFTCEAQMDLAPEKPMLMSHPVKITVHYKPTINTTKLPKTVPVFRGYPEDLTCEADGYPPPKIQWVYDTDKVPHVSENTLTVSEAGFYNCTAANEHGSVFYVVKVILKEDYLPLIAGFVAVTVVAISIIFLFIYSIYYKNTKMRRYSLKNPKLSTHNGNVAHSWDTQFPMTKLS
ncbi:hemicentin-1-like [Toxotes jaculatrix]|uniref:hemicentin-1-like n=1 Tax=Toxotes jaculatrix TaxID=941984 RepID=UPI001B3AB77E|nr:hemicentin-1-like [Toxotes jaculatrix]